MSVLITYTGLQIIRSFLDLAFCAKVTDNSLNFDILSHLVITNATNANANY